MKAPIILEGPAFDWSTTGDCGPVIREDGSVNQMAAAWADPGVMACPNCKVYLWNEGERVRCPDCGHEWDTANKAWAEKMKNRKAKERKP